MCERAGDRKSCVCRLNGHGQVACQGTSQPLFRVVPGGFCVSIKAREGNICMSARLEMEAHTAQSSFPILSGVLRGDAEKRDRRNSASVANMEIECGCKADFLQDSAI